MYDGHTIGVVVPAHDEAGLVGDVIESMPAFVDRTYVVDDCSTDGTWAEIRRHAAASLDREGTDRDDERAREATGTPPAAALSGAATVVGGARSVAASDGDGPPTDRAASVVAIRHARNRGRGGAVKTGYRAALADGADIVAVMDGDDQMDPAILDEIVTPIAAGTADYAKGDRLRSSVLRRGMPAWRLFGNVALTLLTRVASGYWSVWDPQNGYTAISAATLAALDVDRLYERYGFLNDVLVGLNVRGARVADVPMRARYGEEESGIRYTTFVPKISALLLRRFAWRLRMTARTAPAITVLYGLGSTAATVGATGLVRSWRRDDAERGPAGGAFALLLGLVAFVAAGALDWLRSRDLTLRTTRGERR